MAGNNEEILLNLKIQTDKANAALKKTDVAIKKTIQSFKELTKGSIEYQNAQAKLAGLQAKYAEQSLKYNRALEAQIGNTSKGLKGVSNATGGATSAAMELGRVFSDAPYGIRGVANNLSQLASQFSYMSNKVDVSTGKVVGFNGALKQFGQALKANAVLLLIQAVISAMDYFSASVNKADKALTKLSDSTVSESITELTLLKKALENTSTPLEDKQRLIKKAREEYEDFNDAIKETPEDIAGAILALKSLTQEYKDFARAKALTDLVSEAMKKQAKTIATYTGEWTDMFNSVESFALSLNSLRLTGDVSLGIMEAMTSELNTSGDEIKKYEEFLNQKTKSDPNLTYLELIYGKKGKKGKEDARISPFKSKEALEVDIKTNISAVNKLKKQTELINLKTEEEGYIKYAASEEHKKWIKEDYAKQRLEIELNYEKIAIEDSETAELNSLKKIETEKKLALNADLLNYKEKLKEKGVAETVAGKKLIADAEEQTKKKIKITELEALVGSGIIKNKYKTLKEFWEKYAEAKRLALGSQEGAGVDENKILADLERWEGYAKDAKKIIGAVGDFVDSEFDRQLTIEQNKTNSLNAELNNRLLNENLSKDQRASIQNQIAQNDEKLRVKQESIKRKAFKTQKAFNIASALIETYSAASSAFRNTLANPMNRLLPDGGLLKAKIAAGLATAGGLLQVAAISRQKYQSSSASTPVNMGTGGSGGSSTPAEPSFNIVGRSNDNLLLNAIQSQFDQPLRAYVVARDVTNQQQMDGIITDAAGT